MSKTVNRNGPGRLVTDRYSFEKHLNGDDFHHNASHIDINPTISFDGDDYSDVNSLLSNISDFLNKGAGFLTIGKGYDCYPSGTYDSSVPALDDEIDSVLNNTSDPRNSRLKNGGVLVIKSGTYKITQNINVPPGIIILGEGRGTKICNQRSTPGPLFTVQADLSRTTDKSIDSSNPFIFTKENIFCNILIADNFVEPKTGGDTSYKDPINVSGEQPLILVSPGTSCTFDNVKFVGRVSTGLTALSTMPIKYDSSNPVIKGTICTVRNCSIDGFSLALDFSTNIADNENVKNDYLYFTNNKVRVYGKLNGNTSLDANNCFIKSNTCNGHITDNYLYGADNGYVKYVLVFVYHSISLPTQSYPKFSIVNNTGVINKTTSTSSSQMLFSPGLLSSSTYQVVMTTEPNNFENSTFFSNGSNSDEYLKIADIVPTSNKPTIFQKLNGIVEISVGDGSSTFGDFSGAYAIYDALYFINTKYPLSSASFVIRVKSGSYTIDSSHELELKNGKYITIQGADSATVNITVTSTNPIFATESNPSSIGRSLTLKNLNLNSSVSSIINIYNSYFKIKNCNFTDVVVSFRSNDIAVDPTIDIDNNYLHFSNSRFYKSIENPFVILEGRSTSSETSASGFIFDNCEFITDPSSTSTAALLIKPVSGTSYQHYFKNIVFENCVIKLGSSAGFSSNNFKVNSGVLETNPNGVALLGGTLPPIVVENISFNNCQVSTNSNDTYCLIHLVPQGNKNSYTPGTTSYILTEKLEINGGSWKVPSGSFTKNPFSIILNKSIENTKISIKNVEFGFSDTMNDSTHGGQTSDNSYWFGSESDGNWGFFSLCSDILEIENVTISKLNQISTSGDMFVLSNNLNINGLYFKDYKLNSSGTLPYHRLLAKGSGIVKNVNMTGTSGSSSDWITSSAIKSGLLKVVPNTNPFSLEDCFINNFTTGSYNGKIAIRISDEDTTLNRINKLYIKNCKVKSSANYGIYYNDITSNCIISNLTITGCDISDCNYGIRLNTLYFNTINILSNNIYNCQYEGIYVKSTDWGKIINSNPSLSTYGTVNISNNHLSNNYISGSGSDLRFITFNNTNGTAKMYGSCSGNICTINNESSGTLSGTISIYVMNYTAGSISAHPELQDIVTEEFPMLGLETGYSDYYENSGTGASVSKAGSIVTVSGLSYITDDSVGRILQLSGFSTASNNGNFTILSLNSASPTSSVIILNTNASNESGGTWKEFGHYSNTFYTTKRVYNDGVIGGAQYPMLHNSAYLKI